MTLYKVSYSTKLLFVYAIDIEDLHLILLDNDKDIYRFEGGLLYEKTTGIVENIIIKEIKKEHGIIWKQ